MISKEVRSDAGRPSHFEDLGVWRVTNEGTKP
jgi:hypothetical protein